MRVRFVLFAFDEFGHHLILIVGFVGVIMQHANIRNDISAMPYISTVQQYLLCYLRCWAGIFFEHMK